MGKTINNGVFTRTQFPLGLSWAFTIHNIQGKILERLVIDLGEGEICSGQSNGLNSCLNIAKGADVILTSNLWTPVGLQNDDRGKVSYFVYMNSDGPRSHTFPEAVVVELFQPQMGQCT